jgi:hypothetical protein
MDDDPAANACLRLKCHLPELGHLTQSEQLCGIAVRAWDGWDRISCIVASHETWGKYNEWYRCDGIAWNISLPLRVATQSMSLSDAPEGESIDWTSTWSASVKRESVGVDPVFELPDKVDAFTISRLHHTDAVRRLLC